MLPRVPIRVPTRSKKTATGRTGNKGWPQSVLADVSQLLADNVTLDDRLVERLRGGDESAVSELAERYSGRIRQLALRYVRNPDDAEEVLHDVLFKVYRKIEAFRGDAALSSWIYRITFNTAMSRLRALKNDLPGEGARESGPGDWTENRRPAAELEIADWSSLGDDEVMRAELRQKLLRALGDLPPIYRVPVLLRDIHGLSTEEASTLLQVKDQTLKSRLHRGRMILRNRLAEFADGINLHRQEFSTFN
jgi:RNA polymerase sigma-70 factor, ECF subfamily